MVRLLCLSKPCHAPLRPSFPRPAAIRYAGLGRVNIIYSVRLAVLILAEPFRAQLLNALPCLALDLIRSPCLNPLRCAPPFFAGACQSESGLATYYLKSRYSVRLAGPILAPPGSADPRQALLCRSNITGRFCASFGSFCAS